jgi:hypothetical protein
LSFSHSEDTVQNFEGVLCVNCRSSPLKIVRKWAAMPLLGASPAEKREALEEVLQSATFFRAEQLRVFLRYICEMELAGRGDELCESLIGVEAFGRPAGYSPTEDASVRRRAGDLREKLQEVYEGELSGSKVRIELPKGKFLPRFVRVTADNPVDQELARIFPAEHSALEHASLKNATDRPAAMTASAEFSANLIANRVEALVYERTRVWRRRLATFWFAMGWIVGTVMVAACLFAYHWLRPAVPESASAQTAAARIAARGEPPARSALVTPPAVEANAEQARGTPRPAPVEGNQSYEAEAAGNIMHGITGPYSCNWCSGGSRVRNIGKSAHNYLVLNNIVVPRSGEYQMLIYYVLKGDRSFFIRVNNGPAVEAPLSGKSWRHVGTASVAVTLRSGSNSIRFYNEQQYAPDLDRVVIRSP